MRDDNTGIDVAMQDLGRDAETARRDAANQAEDRAALDDAIRKHGVNITSDDDVTSLRERLEECGVKTVEEFYRTKKRAQDNDVHLAEILHGLRAMGIFGINAAGFLAGKNPVGVILAGAATAVALSHQLERGFSEYAMDKSLKIEEMYPYNRRDYDGHFARQSMPYWPGMYAGTAIANQVAQTASHGGLNLSKRDKVLIRWAGGVGGYGVTGGLMAEQHFAQQGDRVNWLDPGNQDMERQLKNLDKEYLPWSAGLGLAALKSTKYIPTGIATAVMSPRTLARWIPQLPYAGLQFLEQRNETPDKALLLDGLRSLADIAESAGLGGGRNYAEYYLNDLGKRIFEVDYSHESAQRTALGLEKKAQVLGGKALGAGNDFLVWFSGLTKKRVPDIEDQVENMVSEADPTTKDVKSDAAVMECVRRVRTVSQDGGLGQGNVTIGR